VGLNRLLGVRDSEEWCNVRGLGLDWFTLKAVPYQAYEEGDAYLDVSEILQLIEIKRSFVRLFRIAPHME